MYSTPDSCDPKKLDLYINPEKVILMNNLVLNTNSKIH